MPLQRRESGALSDGRRSGRRTQQRGAVAAAQRWRLLNSLSIHFFHGQRLAAVQIRRQGAAARCAAVPCATHSLLARMPPVTVVPLLPPQPTSITLRGSRRGGVGGVSGRRARERRRRAQPGVQQPASRLAARAPAQDHVQTLNVAWGRAAAPQAAPAAHPSLGTRVSVRNSNCVSLGVIDQAPEASWLTSVDW